MDLLHEFNRPQLEIRPPFSDDIGPHLAACAQDEALPSDVKGAIILLSTAEKHLLTENAPQALQDASAARDVFRQHSQLGLASDALRLILQSFKFQGQHNFALNTAVEEHKLATDAEDELGQAKISLALAELSGTDATRRPAREEALDRAKASLQIFRSHEDRRMEALTLVVLSEIQLHSLSGGADEMHSHFEEAVGFAREALALLEQSGSWRSIARAHRSLAGICQARGDIEEAALHLQRAVHVYREIEDQMMEACELHSLATWLLVSNRADQARDNAEQALHLFRTTPCRRAWEAAALGTLVEVYSALGKRRKLLQAAQQGLRRFQGRLGDKTGEGHALLVVAYAHLQLSDFEGAEWAAGQTLSISQDQKDGQAIGAAWRMLAVAQLFRQEVETAVASAKKALEAFKGRGDNAAQASAWWLIATGRFLKEDYPGARKAAEEVWTNYDRCGDEKGQGNSLLLCTSIANAQDDYEAAGSYALEAQRHFARARWRAGEARAFCVLSEVQMQRQSFDRALGAAARAKELLEDSSNAKAQASVRLLEVQAQLRRITAESFEQASFEFHESVELAYASCKEAIEHARRLEEDWELLSSCLFWSAQAALMDWRPDEALAFAEEAVSLLRQAGEAMSEGSVLELVATAYKMLNQWEHAWLAASDAQWIYQEKGNAAAEASVDELLRVIEQFYTPPPEKRRQKKKEKGPEESDAIVPVDPAAAFDPAARMRDLTQQFFEREGKQGPVKEPKTLVLPKFDKSQDLTVDVVKQRLIVCLDELGVDSEEIQADTGLMTLGLTSGNALMLRNMMVSDFTGVNIPATLAFDYPSLNELSAFIATQASDLT